VCGPPCPESEAFYTNNISICGHPVASAFPPDGGTTFAEGGGDGYRISGEVQTGGGDGRTLSAGCDGGTANCISVR
jgi:hypothetical protein